MTCRSFGHFRIIYSNIMKSTGARAFLAFVILIVTTSKARCNPYGHRPHCEGLDLSGAIASGAEVVTYGDSCTCKGSVPYSIQVPKKVPAPVETRKSYGFSVVVPPSELIPRHLELPVQIQTPAIKKKNRDYLSGKSYGVSVEQQVLPAPTITYSYDCSVEKPLKVIHQHKVYKPLDCAIEYLPQKVTPHLAPLPIAIQKPIHKPQPKEYQLTGLSTSVDRVLIPACEYSGVIPDCTDTVTAKHHIPSPHLHSDLPCL